MRSCNDQRQISDCYLATPLKQELSKLFFYQKRNFTGKNRKDLVIKRKHYYGEHNIYARVNKIFVLPLRLAINVDVHQGIKYCMH